MAEEERGGGGTQPCEQRHAADRGGNPRVQGRPQLSTRQRHDRRRHTPHARRRRAHELNATRSSHFMSAAITRRSSAYRFAAARHLRSADRTERASVPPTRLGRPPAATAQSERCGAALRPSVLSAARWPNGEIPAAAARSLRVTAARCVASAAHVAKARRRRPPSLSAAATRRSLAQCSKAWPTARSSMPGSRQSHVAQGSRQLQLLSVRARHRRVPPPGCPPAHDARRARGVHCPLEPRGGEGACARVLDPRAERTPLRAKDERGDAAADECERCQAVGRRRTPRVGGAAGGAQFEGEAHVSQNPDDASPLRRSCAPREDAAFQLDAPPSRQSGAQLGVARRVLQPGGHAPRARGAAVVGGRGGGERRARRQARSEAAEGESEASAEASASEPSSASASKAARSRRAVWRRSPPPASASPGRPRTVSCRQRAAGAGGAYAQAVCELRQWRSAVKRTSRSAGATRCTRQTRSTPRVRLAMSASCSACHEATVWSARRAAAAVRR